MRWRLQPSLRIINTKLPYKGGGVDVAQNAQGHGKGTE